VRNTSYTGCAIGVTAKSIVVRSSWVAGLTRIELAITAKAALALSIAACELRGNSIVALFASVDLSITTEATSALSGAAIFHCSDGPIALFVSIKNAIATSASTEAV
jgi:hypothetical protein